MLAEYLSYLNLLIVPVLIWVIKIERLLQQAETSFKAEKENVRDKFDLVFRKLGL